MLPHRVAGVAIVWQLLWTGAHAHDVARAEMSDAMVGGGTGDDMGGGMDGSMGDGMVMGCGNTSCGPLREAELLTTGP